MPASLIKFLTIMGCFVGYFIIGSIVEKLEVKYKKWKIFLFGTLICVGFYGLFISIFLLTRPRVHVGYTSDLNIWQYLIIFDVFVYFLFLMVMLLGWIKPRS